MKIINKDIFDAIDDLEDDSIRCIVTSPPYYQARNYGNKKQIGLENTYQEYLNNLCRVFELLKQKLTNDGNLFVNIGDKYDKNKNLMLIPYHFGYYMQLRGWIIRNKIIWYKPNHQPSPVKDRLTNTYEEIFHFVKNKKYYYDLDSTRIPFKQDENENKKVYERFYKKIKDSAHLTKVEKELAIDELNKLYTEGKINKDARIKIRNQAKILFGGDKKLSGRAKELETKGFYFHCNNPKGKNMGDMLMVNIKSHHGIHEAVFPDELIEPLIKMGSAKGDIVFDPFAGTGTTCRVADKLGRTGIGVELNNKYIYK
ncbi:DNA methyltransferase [Bacillus smithii]|uniref:DNA methyltransferase n=1 Tax=Bacillus smithii TaxID=1479 RepID=UPI002E1F1B25|nr:DNA methyltransferase [Bacillus smithii]MED4928242.1 DNA methyltransferase [Bacillus smithii]